MVMYAKIRRMFSREHLSISEIVRRTRLSRIILIGLLVKDFLLAKSVIYWR